jgi:hypothetical protein
MFDIAFIADPPEDEDGWLALRGRTVLGNYSEEFMSELGFWTRRDYEQHWLQSAARILNGGSKAAFFTSAFQFFWAMWRNGNLLLVHEHLLLPEMQAAIATENLHSVVPEYEAASENGETISEWRISIDEMREFHQRRIGQ